MAEQLASIRWLSGACLVACPSPHIGHTGVAGCDPRDFSDEAPTPSRTPAPPISRRPLKGRVVVVDPTLTCGVLALQIAAEKLISAASSREGRRDPANHPRPGNGGKDDEAPWGSNSV